VICPRQFCPIERAAKAMDEMIREGEKRGARFSAEMEHHQQCDLCRRCVGWVRLEGGEHRALRGKEDEAA
jgi:hypothetical protein